jgi:antirestriction protein ArdC
MQSTKGKTIPIRRLFARATPVLNADQIIHGGGRACFIPKLDEIHAQRASFTGSATSTATEAYYSTVLHELTHWTAPPHRCNRDLTGRFGSEAYAMEELVAELGAAFLCAELRITVEPRPWHIG